MKCLYLCILAVLESYNLYSYYNLIVTISGKKAFKL